MITTDEVRKYASTIDYSKNFLKDYNGLLLTENQIELLQRYGLSVEECGSMTELLYMIDEVLDEEESPELEWLAEILQERQYYENTDK